MCEHPPEGPPVGPVWGSVWALIAGALLFGVIRLLFGFGWDY